jgi:hypothetical protein
MKRIFIIALAASLLNACEKLEDKLLTNPVKDALELATVIPAEEIVYASNGTLSDGRNLNPVLSKSLRTFEKVTVIFPEDTVETLKGVDDYDVFAWRKSTRHLGEGELECDVAPAPTPVVDLGTVLKVGKAALKLGTVAATFAPVRGRTLITNYDSSRNDRLVSLSFRKGEVTVCD